MSVAKNRGTKRSDSAPTHAWNPALQIAASKKTECQTGLHTPDVPDAKRE
jgi:hypothetical protein